MAKRDLIARAAELARHESEGDIIARAAQRAIAEDGRLGNGFSLKEIHADQHDAHGFDHGAAPKTKPKPKGAEAGQRLQQRTSVQTIDWGRFRLEGGLVPHAEPSRLTEEFRIIKQPLIALACRKAPDDIPHANIIMVTSARPLEGKTYVAINLAMSLASERDMNVLLIDGDCHRPTVLQRLGLRAERGLLDVLQDPELDLADVLVRTDCPNLSVLPSGRRVPESTEILASQQMEALISDISSRYSDRIVIFDAPPTLATTEASVLARHVGQIVLVVEANVTSASVVQEACTFLGACKNLSIVLNKREAQGDDSEFGGYYE